MHLVEQTQYKAGLVVSGCWQGTSREKLYKELGWESEIECGFTGWPYFIKFLMDPHLIWQIIYQEKRKIASICAPKEQL